jgi:drug/metabolite transporter (DMT)-like permease
MDDSLHLLLPLFSSIVFVVGAMFAKRATSLGASPYTSTFLSNGCLALCWGIVGVVRSEGLPLAEWGPAVMLAAAFVGGQLCTYLAFQIGDVSLATPIFGVKIILVALISSFLAEKPIELRLWIAATLAATGIAVLQGGSGSRGGARLTAKRVALTIVLAVLAATSLSLFDVGLQHYGRRHGAERFLTTMFVMTGVLSAGLLPWADRPARLRETGAARPLVAGAILIAIQAIGISYALGRFGDATRVNIVYSLRGLWSVILAWLLNQLATSPEGRHSTRTMTFRLIGASLLTVSVVVALL